MDFSIKVCFVCALIPITDILVTRLSLFSLSLYIPLYLKRYIIYSILEKSIVIANTILGKVELHLFDLTLLQRNIRLITPPTKMR